nr:MULTISPECIES: hypothetical protein [unclassified Tardiphaga]
MVRRHPDAGVPVDQLGILPMREAMASALPPRREGTGLRGASPVNLSFTIPM